MKGFLVFLLCLGWMKWSETRPFIPRSSKGVSPDFTGMGGVAQGSFSVLEPDGMTQVVEYTADMGGYMPMVSYEPMYGSGMEDKKSMGDVGDTGYGNGGSDGDGVGDMRVDPLDEEVNYRFQYEVKDPESGNDFGHMEARMGNTATGSYHVLLPDGRVQRVDYVADQDGYKPMISYEGEAKYGPGVGVGKPMVDDAMENSIGGYSYYVRR